MPENATTAVGSGERDPVFRDVVVRADPCKRHG